MPAELALVKTSLQLKHILVNTGAVVTDVENDKFRS